MFVFHRISFSIARAKIFDFLDLIPNGPEFLDDVGHDDLSGREVNGWADCTRRAGRRASG
jgi:hypothetical protein